MATVAFTGGGFHLQILSATLGKEMKMSLHSPAYSSASEEEQGAAKCSLFVGKMSRGVLNMADESGYLSEEDPTC